MRIAILLLAALPASAELLHLVPDGLPLRLTVDKTGLYRGRTHLFEFPSYSGTVEFDAANPALSKVELSVEVREIRLLDNWVNEKDRRSIVEMALSDKILDAQAHPSVRFRSTSVEASDAGYRVQGELEIRGIAKPAVLDVRISHDGDALIVDGTAAFSVKPYGIKIPRGALGLIGTKDEMRFEFRVRAER